ncbi:hypothetical protein [Hyphomicrobium sp. 2TAF46]|uniref:hypothetical protein n=1 Tax=Hyphomicrobium sp. 2TAF46 TaxID=3233019 RepID=UPI003F903F28
MAADGPSGARGRVRVGLVVVHGVGETEPGYCVNAVLDTLASTRPGYSVSPANEYNRIAEPEAGSPPPVFPVIRRGAAHTSGIEIEAVELHWADLTTVQEGRVNTLLQLFRVIFESHHLVDAMLDRTRDVISWLLRKILWVAGWLIRGPSAALTIVTSVICGLFLFEPATLTTDVVDVRSQVLIVTAIMFIGSLYVFYRISRQQDYSWYDTVFWLGIAALAVFGLTFYDVLLPLLKNVPDLEIGPERGAGAHVVDCAVAGSSAAACYINGLYKVIIWGWRIWGGIMLFATALLGIAYLRALKTGDRSRLATVSTSIAILIMQFLLWTTVVVSAIYPILNRAETITTLKEAKPFIERAIEAHQIDRNSAVAKLVQVPNIELDWIGRFKFIFAAAALTVMLFIIGGGILIELRHLRARRGLSDLEHTARNMPRLLFNPFLVGLLIIAFIVVFALVFVQPYLDSNHVFVTLRSYILPLAAVVALVLPFFFGRRIANVVNVARDLIDHHYQPRQETAAYFIPSAFRARFRHLRRERIQGRLNLVLEHFVQNQGYDGVIFLAHSQGSVIVYDFLRDNGPHYTRLGDASPALLTFGSPLGTLYQKYFHEYSASKGAPLGIAASLKCWINLYRVDDYIGGRINPPRGLRIDNHVMGIGGHTGYWTEPAVAEALDAILTGKVADATKPPPLPPPPMTPSAPYAVRAMRRA